MCAWLKALKLKCEKKYNQFDKVEIRAFFMSFASRNSQQSAVHLKYVCTKNCFDENEIIKKGFKASSSFSHLFPQEHRQGKAFKLHEIEKIVKT